MIISFTNFLHTPVSTMYPVKMGPIIPGIDPTVPPIPINTLAYCGAKSK